jgi:chromosome segregation ATPase
VVSTRHPDLYHYLAERFANDEHVEVILDRRRRDRRRAGVSVQRERRLMDRRGRPDVDAELETRSHVMLKTELEGADIAAVRQRLTHWISEGEHLAAAVLPELFASHEALRLRAQRLEQAAEEDRRQLGAARQELDVLRQEVNAWRSESDRARAERADLGAMVEERLNRLARMIQELARRLPAPEP